MVVVGRFGPPFGIRGWLNVISYTEPVTNLLDYRPWFIEQRDGWTALAVGDLKPHRKGFIAQIDGITDRDEALRLAGRPIGVADDALPATADDEFYWKDLIGMKVQDRSGQVLGEVTGLIETGANDVIVVRGPAGEHLIPFLRHVVVDVNVPARRIAVDWQEAE